MTPLSGLDSLFLHLETSATPMHVGALHVLQMPRGYRGDFTRAVRRHVAARLHLAPLFTRTLAPVPLALANPLWQELAADEVDLDHHITRITLPRPGTQAQLENAVAELHAELLERTRPLWRFFVIDGLQSGGRAFYSKIHHATLDGAAGVALARALLDPSPVPAAMPAPPRQARAPAPLPAQVLKAALLANLHQVGRLARSLPQLAQVAVQLVQQARGGDARSNAMARNFSFGPHTPLNVAITGPRVIATASLPLARLKQLAAVHEVRLNDIVLTLAAGALRHYLAAHGGVPARPLVAAMPVSLRAAGNTEATTLATMTLTRLATDIAHPIERLQAIGVAAGAAKALTASVRAVIPTDFPSFGLPWLLSAVAGLYGRSRLADRLPPIANLVISNVPGPAEPLYLAGARLQTYWPLSIVEHGLGLNITVQSYAGSLDIGLVGARNAVPDIERLAQGLHTALDELTAATAAAGADVANAAAAATAARRPRASPRAPRQHAQP